MDTRDRRFTIALLLALAAHAALLAAVARVAPETDVPAVTNRVITVTLTTRASPRPVDSRVIAEHAQRGRAPFSREAQGRTGASTRYTAAPESPQTNGAGSASVQRLTAENEQYATVLSRPAHDSNDTASAEQASRRLSRRARADPRAAYLSAWQRRIEQYGNHHYPGDLIRSAPRNRLTLAVTLRADGSVQSVRVRRSSGSRALDAAARAIVHKAGPYAPFPDELRRFTPRLTFAYDWVFGR